MAGKWIDSWPSCIKNHQHPCSDINLSTTLAYDVLNEDFVLGAALLQSVRAWVVHTHGYLNASRAKPRTAREYNTLREYLDYRAMDMGCE